MKKIVFVLTSLVLLSCKKESSNSNSNSNSSSEINFNSSGNAVAKFGLGVKDIDGNSYKTTIIGSQEWMAENLKVTKFNDGTTIKNITESLEWVTTNLPAWCVYDNDLKNNSKYGKLYNWFVISESMKNICPSGWHIPSIDEWEILMEFLGGENVAAGKMKEVGITNWASPNVNATNSSLFTALPAGVRSENDGRFHSISYDSNWWSSTLASESNVLTRDVDHDDSSSEETSEDIKTGLSIRCIKN